MSPTVFLAMHSMSLGCVFLCVCCVLCVCVCLLCVCVCVFVLFVLLCVCLLCVVFVLCVCLVCFVCASMYSNLVKFRLQCFSMTFRVRSFLVKEGVILSTMSMQCFSITLLFCYVNCGQSVSQAHCDCLRSSAYRSLAIPGPAMNTHESSPSVKKKNKNKKGSR